MKPDFKNQSSIADYLSIKLTVSWKTKLILQFHVFIINVFIFVYTGLTNNSDKLTKITYLIKVAYDLF